MEHKAVKYSIFGAIIAALITGGVALYTHYDTKNEKKEAEKLQKLADESKDTANLTITNVYVPPVNTIAESAFYAEIINNSRKEAENIKVTVNFGSSNIRACETLPINVFESNNSYTSTSIVSFSVDSIKRKDSFYIYCLISNPEFKSILITGPNLYSSTKYAYSEFRSIQEDNESSYLTFFKVVGSIVAVVFIIYFTLLIISLLNKITGGKV